MSAACSKIFPVISIALVMVPSKRKGGEICIGWQCKCCIYCMTVHVCDSSQRHVLNVHTKRCACACHFAAALPTQSKRALFLVLK